MYIPLLLFKHMKRIINNKILFYMIFIGPHEILKYHF